MSSNPEDTASRISSELTDETIERDVDVFKAIAANIRRVIKGKDDVIFRVCVLLAADGNVLFEEVPGTGKTKLVKALARSVDGAFRRIQFTPDLFPGEITTRVVQKPEGGFEIDLGPIFTNFLLADEINRATPKTQSGLLEAMEEGQVTVNGVTKQLPEPFFVLATQNPIEQSGTNPLPEAQLDRFLGRIEMGYPDREAAKEMLDETEDVADLRPVATIDDILVVQKDVRAVYVHDRLKYWIDDLANATRDHPDVKNGISPRAEKGIMRVAQAHALLNSRNYVAPEDILVMLASVIMHRVLFASSSTEKAFRTGKRTYEEFISELLEIAPRPSKPRNGGWKQTI